MGRSRGGSEGALASAVWEHCVSSRVDVWALMVSSGECVGGDDDEDDDEAIDGGVATTTAGALGGELAQSGIVDDHFVPQQLAQRD